MGKFCEPDTKAYLFLFSCHHHFSVHFFVQETKKKYFEVLNKVTIQGLASVHFLTFKDSETVMVVCIKKLSKWKPSLYFLSGCCKHSNCHIKFTYSEKATKFCEISTVDLSYVVPVKSTVEISQNFMTFSEYMNFNSCSCNNNSSSR